MTFIEDPNETCGFCGGMYVKRSENKRLAKLEADARALWSVRVLDAVPYCCSGWEGPAPAPEQASNGTYFVFVRESHWGHDPDAARHAAAQAVYPTLPADVRAELGECP